MQTAALLTVLYDLAENVGNVLDDWDEDDIAQLRDLVNNLADTLARRDGAPPLIEAAQLALATIKRNGVFELSERVALERLDAAIRASGATPRDALTTDELIALL
jgi:hypothetical protein